MSTTYYDILQIPTHADTATIQAAFSSRYNEAMGLVNHHNPEIANQAQQLMRALEQARDTLTNPVARQNYDVGLNLNGILGGLIDPTIQIETTNTTTVNQLKPMAPPPPKPQQNGNTAYSASNTVENIWACGKCGAINDPHTRHCRSCRNLLLDACPNCKQIELLTRTNNCGHCGLSLKEAQHIENNRQNLIEEIKVIWEKQNALQKEIDNIPDNLIAITALVTAGSFIGGFISFIYSQISENYTPFVICVLLFISSIVLNFSLDKGRNNTIKQKQDIINELHTDIEHLKKQIITIDGDFKDDKNFMRKTYSREILRNLFYLMDDQI
jgi:ribosomal protein L40E